MSETVFDFDSGDLSLDYANTQEWHASEKPEEKLNSYEDLLAWGEAAGLLTAEQAGRLRRLALEQPEKSAEAYRAALRAREALYRIFSSRYAGRPVPEADLELLNGLLRTALAHRRLDDADGDMRWQWAPEIEGPNLILWPVAHAAAELLTTDKASRLRECEDDRGCGYLFIDQSRNRSRRWCSMESCGNRAKARRHYSKSQGG